MKHRSKPEDRCAGSAALPVLVADAMLHHPKVWPAEATVGELRVAFDDDHVHAALVVEGQTLLAVVTRPDIATCPDTEPARRQGRLSERVINPDADLAEVWARMTRERTRRLAVTDHDDTLLGLLCLKCSGRGFCSDADVAARAAEQRGWTVVEAGAPGPRRQAACDELHRREHSAVAVGAGGGVAPHPGTTVSQNRICGN